MRRKRVRFLPVPLCQQRLRVLHSPVCQEHLVSVGLASVRQEHCRVLHAPFRQKRDGSMPPRLLHASLRHERLPVPPLFVLSGDPKPAFNPKWQRVQGETKGCGSLALGAGAGARARAGQAAQAGRGSADGCRAAPGFRCRSVLSALFARVYSFVLCERAHSLGKGQSPKNKEFPWVRSCVPW